MIELPYENKARLGAKPILGGGFKDFLCSPRKLGKVSNLTSIFSNGVVQPPTSIFFSGSLDSQGGCIHLIRSTKKKHLTRPRNQSGRKCPATFTEI